MRDKNKKILMKCLKLKSVQILSLKYPFDIQTFFKDSNLEFI